MPARHSPAPSKSLKWHCGCPCSRRRGPQRPRGGGRRRTEPPDVSPRPSRTAASLRNRRRVMRQRNLFVLSAFVAAALWVASPAFAQLQTGNLYGEAKDQSGGVLPGVTVTLSGQGAPQVRSEEHTSG